jgi:fibronectin type 3 domain-containing protein
MTIPVANHGMPVQRTYTEWKHSAFGRNEAVPGVTDTRCQGCHMPTMKHEYTDTAPVSLNPDPLVSGWYPYSKDRNIGGGTAFHKFAGGDRDLPQMMKVLYPEVDLEVVGAPTGHDSRIFPGMLSDRGPMWDRATRNTEVALRDAVSAQITGAPTLDPATGRWQVRVRVTNHSGHKVPSGFPAGQRMWVSLVVKDATGAVVYQSGHYDPASARLYNDAASTVLARALTPAIDSAANAVMVYEKVTGTCTGTGTGTPPTSCTASENLLNDTILFDNRIPPLGYDYALAGPLGGAFWTYDPTSFVPAEDAARYPADATTGFRQNFDEVTYTFDAPVDAVLTARAEVNYQSHSREYMDHLVSATNALPAAERGPRPEGPPSPLAPNYPQTPTFLSDSIAVTTGEDFATLADLAGDPLQDNWAGVAYAAWLLTGKGAPFVMAADDTAVAEPPAAPATVTVTSPINPDTGLTDPNAQLISWSAVDGADGYRVWVRYGASDLTASWDRLAIVPAPQTSLLNVALNVAKTYAYRVEAFNAKGYGLASADVVQSTPVDVPLPPINTRVTGVTGTTVTLTWFDQADNELGFIIERQDVPADRNQPLPLFREIARIPTPNGAAFGGVTFTDGTPRVTCPTPTPLDPDADGCYVIDPVNPANGWVPLQPGQTYNYRVSAYNASGSSGPDLPVGATTRAVPLAPSALTATVAAGSQINLSWTDNSGNETGFRIERSLDGLTFAAAGSVGPNVTAFTDATVVPATTYQYRVIAFNALGSSQPSNVATVTTPAVPPASPSALTATPSLPSPNPPTVALAWTDNAVDEQGFVVERAPDVNGVPGAFVAIATLPPDAASYIDAAVASKTTYHYRVSAFNAVGSSLPSNVATATTPGEIPQAPSSLRVTITTATTVTLLWQDNASNETGFFVERAPNVGGAPGAWTRIATLGANAQRYRDTGLARRTTYWYRVQAFNADGPSEYSNVISGTTR